MPPKLEKNELTNIYDLLVQYPTEKNYGLFYTPMKLNQRLYIVSSKPEKFKQQINLQIKLMNQETLLYKENNFLVTMPIICVYFKDDWEKEESYSNSENIADILACFREYVEPDQKVKLDKVID